MEILETETAIHRDNEQVSVGLGPGWGDTWGPWGRGLVLHLDGGGSSRTLVCQSWSHAAPEACRTLSTQMIPRRVLLEMPSLVAVFGSVGFCWGDLWG